MNKTKILMIIVLVSLLVFLGGCSSGICGTHTETYTTSVKGCDGMQNCRCLHQSWGGLGACDSCQCAREVSNC